MVVSMATMSVAESSVNGSYNFQRSDRMTFFALYHDEAPSFWTWARIGIACHVKRHD
jgi:hypothetical protein